MGAFADLPLEPLSDHYGWDRGTPLDRHYIETFLAEHSDVIRGSVLEVQDDAYTRAFGADRVTMSTVVDIDDANQRATLIADLSQPASLPADAYDCIILTQTLHLIPRPERCVENCYRGLRPGGTLLATAPSLSRVSPSYRRRLLAVHAGRPLNPPPAISEHWSTPLLRAGSPLVSVRPPCCVDTGFASHFADSRDGWVS
jgi:SAM-dependent methyltransferase